MRSSAEADRLESPAWNPANALPPWAASSILSTAVPAVVQRSLVRTLQRDLIPRLARAHRPALAQLGALDVDGFTTDLLQGDERVLLVRLDSLRQRGFSVQALCLDLLAPTACRLGELWNDDRCDFASVTIAVSQLQRLMRLLGTAWMPGLHDPGAGLRVLLLQSPQEQHSFGLAMAAEFFRCAGWGVSGGLAEHGISVSARARAQHIDVAGFSVGTEAQLEWLRGQIVAVRQASLNRKVVVMVGGPLFALRPDWAHDMGADLCVADARDAPALAERLVRAPALARN